MRSMAMIAAAAAVFVLFLVRNHWRAADLLRAEADALARLRALASAPPAPPSSARGYRFERLDGYGLPPLLVAWPEREGVDGVRHFAAAPDGRVFAYDPLAVRPSGGAPDATPLRLYLARPPPEREGAPPPPGWRLLE